MPGRPDAGGGGTRRRRPGETASARTAAREVAQLAGVSVDYYTRLEQGRHSSPSEAVLEALARVFRLEPAARAHLADLARPVRHKTAPPPAQRVRPAMQQLIASMSEHPALILGRRTDVLAANTLARELFTDWTRMPPRERNYARWMFLDPAAAELFLDWRTVAAEVVGTLRLYAGRHPVPGDADQVLFIYHTDPGSSSHDNLGLLALLSGGTARRS